MLANRLSLLICLVLLPPLFAGAQDTNAPAVPEDQDDTGWSMGEQVDELQKDISSGILHVSHQFDSFFGEDIIDDDQDGTLVRLQIKAEVAESNKRSLSSRISVRLRLPQLHERVQLIFDDFVEGNDEKDIIQEVKDSEPLTGIRYVLQSEKARFNVDLGVKVRMEPDAFIRARVSKVFPMDPWSLKLSQDVYWFVRDGPGEVTQVRFSRRLNDSYLFRASTRGKWDESHDGITVGQAFALYHEVSVRRAIRYTVSAAMPTSPSTVMDEYNAIVTWRQLVRGDWLYVEVEPNASFPRERDYKFTPSIIFKLEMMFGDAPEGFAQ